MTQLSVADEFAGYLSSYGSGRVDLAQALCDSGRDGAALALAYEGPAGDVQMTYAELAEASRCLAGGFEDLGVAQGDRVAVLLQKSPELLITLLAIWRRGAVHVPLFTAFGPDAVAYRLAHSKARLVVTDGDNRPKIASRGPTPVVNVAPVGAVIGRDHDLAAVMNRAKPLAACHRAPGDPFILLYTSGTTGKPKGVPVPIRALASFQSYMRHGLDLRLADTLWNFGDPGWGYGLYYGVVGTLLLGQTIFWRAQPFDPDDFYATILRRGVTNLGGAPTVYRSLRAAGVPRGFRELHRLRAISSAGEPLNPELIEWSWRELGVAIRDHYGQSEIGMAVFCAQHPHLRQDPLQAGSMGTPAPGIQTAVLDDHGAEVGPGGSGELAIDTQCSPGYWFGGYYRDAERTAERFRYGDRYYLTGDTVRLDESGVMFYDSRADDVITSSGYRIGPFEVESALIAHPSVAEAAVIGTPDERRVEAVTAYIVLSTAISPSAALISELQAFVKAKLARHLYPRHVVFVDELPRTASGKVRRTELRRDWEARAWWPGRDLRQG